MQGPSGARGPPGPQGPKGRRVSHTAVSCYLSRDYFSASVNLTCDPSVQVLSLNSVLQT